MAPSAQNIDITDVFYTSRDGLKLHIRDYRPLDAVGAMPVICLPGLSRNTRDFDKLAKTIAGTDRNARRVVVFDYRGRGLSQYDPNWENYNVAVEADDVLNGLAVLGIEHGKFIGTSRGGLIIMALAGMRPSVLKAAVLNDIGPVIDGAGLMQIRGYLQQLNAPKNWAQAVETQKAIMAKNFPAFTEDDWEHEAACRYVKDQSAIKADYDQNLAKTMRALDARSRLPTAWPQFAGLKNIPLLVIRGENSNILSHKTLLDMAQVHHRMEHFTAVGQGHAPALHVGEIPSRIRDFLIRTSL